VNSIFTYYCAVIATVIIFTVPLPGPRDLTLQDVTHSSMNVLWDPAPGKVRKYILRYKIADEADTKEVNDRKISERTRI